MGTRTLSIDMQELHTFMSESGSARWVPLSRPSFEQEGFETSGVHVIVAWATGTN